MKQKLIITAALVSLFGVIVVMSFDLFLKKGDDTQNQYEYDLAKLKQVDSGQICYRENFQIKPKVSFEEGTKHFTNWVQTQPKEESTYEKSLHELKEKGLFK